MNAEFNEVYERMLAEYPLRQRTYRSFFFQTHDQNFQSIKGMIENVCENRNVKLRPDAKYFLVSNFDQMVAVPLTVVRGTQERGRISEMIHKDIDYIISTAAQNAKSENEISGGTIVKTLAQIWEKLSTNSAWL